jgi:hypothetical protein
MTQQRRPLPSMRSFRFLLALFALLPVCSLPIRAASFTNPRVALVISKTSYRLDWETIQTSSHGWAGVSNLAGLPYDSLFLEDLASTGALEKFTVLIFAQCTSADEATYNQLIPLLTNYLARGGAVVLDGPLAIFDEHGKERNHKALDDVLGLQYAGFQGDTSFRIQVLSNRHYVTRPFEATQYLTPVLGDGLHILKFRDGGDLLLVSTDGTKTYPYLSCRSEQNKRVVLISDMGTKAGPATFFRNDKPQSFYANQLWTALIRAMHWAAYGDLSVPFPTPQVSNANLTAVVRLDGDNSGDLQFQLNTMRFLIGVAQDTGVVPLYTWVSSFATKAGWDKLAPLGHQLEDLGAELATHSKFHEIDRKMTESRWHEELDGSVQEIEENMKAQGYPIHKIHSMINPGDTIPMEDYDQVAKRFSFYMTHGLEQSVPIGYGNLTWFTGANRDFVVLENAPHPDYQWFYDPEWSYTTGQITDYEEAIFDHMFRNIGRGVIFNEMWHDYSISSMPVNSSHNKSNRITNISNLPFYQAMKAKFGTLPIYCPEPTELAQKLRAMAQWNYSWSATPDSVELNLDLSTLRLEETAQNVGGMGIHIENTQDYIQSATIDGQPYFAYSDRTIILPDLSRKQHKLVVRMGPSLSPATRLVYISKHLRSVSGTPDDLEFTIETKARARFALEARNPAVLLHADSQQWNFRGDHQLEGYVVSDRQVKLKKLRTPGFGITLCTTPIANVVETRNAVEVTLQGSSGSESLLTFQSSRPPRSIDLGGGQHLDTKKQGMTYSVTLPAVESASKLSIFF